MGYIGQAPANKVVKTADIEDSAITSAKILDGTIVNADVNASAAIAESKLTVSSFDDTDLRSDIMTLALKEAITENRVAYNLPNAMIEQFQDDSKIGTETTVDRNTSEYVGTTGTNGGTDVLLLLHFEDTSPFLDSSLHARTVTTVGSVARSNTQTKIGSYTANFPGTADSYLSVPDHADFDFSGDFTMECWFYHETAGHNEGALFDKGYHQAGNPFNFLFYRFHESNTNNETYFKQGTSMDSNLTWADDSHHNDGNWHHYALVRNGSTVTNYFDGTSKGSVTNTNSIGASDANLFIGSNANAAGNSIQGYMDEVRITQTAEYTTTFTPSTSAFGDPAKNATGTLISTANTANAAQTKVSGVILYKNNAGTATLGTDLKIYFTCDGGSNWTESTPTAAGTFSSGILMAKCPEVTCTAGTDIRYKAVWANQAVAKDTQLHGIGVNY